MVIRRTLGPPLPRRRELAFSKAPSSAPQRRSTRSASASGGWVPARVARDRKLTNQKRT
jgi:hypothetical protein